MELRLHVFNPSDFSRSGTVTVPWHRISEAAGEASLDPNGLMLLDDADLTLPFQVDEIDPKDPSRLTLAFRLNRMLPEGDNDYAAPSGYVSLVRGGPPPEAPDTLRLVKHGPADDPHRITLANGIMEVSISLTPGLKEVDERTRHAGYAGSAFSVLFYGRELLDTQEWGHDPEKRCMQLDHIRLHTPAWDLRPEQRVTMFDRKYTLVSSNRGAVRACVTLASDPFDYAYWDPLKRKEQRLRCRVFRVISIYPAETFLTEELFVKGFPDEKAASKNFVNLEFTPSYFAYLRASHHSPLHALKYESIPDWFAAAHLFRPYNGFGFATDMHARAVAIPHPAFASSEGRDNSLSWELFPCREAKCLHLFTRFVPDDTCSLPGEKTWWDMESRKIRQAKEHFEGQIGRAWYLHIYKPLMARLVS